MDEQVPQEAHHVGTTEGALLHLHEELAGGGERADGGEVVVGKRDAQDRRLPAWGIGAHARWQQVEAGLVYPDDGALLVGRPLLSAGHCSSCHARARRLMCAGWYRTPKCTAITAAIRAVVHTLPVNPYASAPLASNSGTCAHCAGDSF